MTALDTIATTDGRVIPPPTEADMRIHLKGSYEDACEQWLHREAGLIRRCHAAESEAGRLAEEIASLRAALERRVRVCHVRGICEDCREDHKLLTTTDRSIP